MRGVAHAGDKEQNDGHKQAQYSGNATAPRKQGSQAGNALPKEREKMHLTLDEEAWKNDGPRVSKVQPIKRKWRRLLRELNEEGGLLRCRLGRGQVGKHSAQPKEKNQII